jgi:hypothetical protein
MKYDSIIDNYKIGDTIQIIPVSPYTEKTYMAEKNSFFKIVDITKTSIIIKNTLYKSSINISDVIINAINLVKCSKKEIGESKNDLCM